MEQLTNIKSEDNNEYKIIINDVSKFRYELIKMIEKVRYNLDGYAVLSSSKIAERFEKDINLLKR